MWQLIWNCYWLIKYFFFWIDKTIALKIKKGHKVAPKYIEHIQIVPNNTETRKEPQLQPPPLTQTQPLNKIN